MMYWNNGIKLFGFNLGGKPWLMAKQVEYHSAKPEMAAWSIKVLWYDCIAEGWAYVNWASPQRYTELTTQNRTLASGLIFCWSDTEGGSPDFYIISLRLFNKRVVQCVN